ncbi:MAG: lipopolysaccharide heptosyltransferase II [Candidatus Eisenbacteria bacterium]|nr:lipopolysaccharide heptosyltransferase II [Candidatus Eisenbacteria bacterium]
MPLREFHPESVESILVIRLYFIGDVLLSTPVLEALGRSFPNASLTVAIKRRAGDVLLGNPFVDETIVYDAVGNYHNPGWIWRLARSMRQRKFSLSVDLTGDYRSSWMVLASDPAFRVGFNRVGMGFLLDRRMPYRAPGHVVDHLLSVVEPIGATADDPSPRLYLSDEERRDAEELLSAVGLASGRALAALAPGANWLLRRWPPERFGALARWLVDRHGLATVIVGSRDDVGLAETVVRASGGAATSLAGRTSLRVAAAVAARASVFVGNDSGPLHMAAAVGTPVVGLFGPNTPLRFAPRGAPSRVVYSSFPCSPCGQRGCSRTGETCMQAISLDEVKSKLDSLLVEVGTDDRAGEASVGDWRGASR